MFFIWSFYIIGSSISISAIYLAINNHLHLSCIVTYIGIIFAYYYITAGTILNDTIYFL
jgi:hypothetical protein